MKCVAPGRFFLGRVASNGKQVNKCTVEQLNSPMDLVLYRVHSFNSFSPLINISKSVVKMSGKASEKKICEARKREERG